MLTAEHAREQLAQADAHVAKTERQIADQVERIKRLEKLESRYTPRRGIAARVARQPGCSAAAQEGDRRGGRSGREGACVSRRLRKVPHLARVEVRRDPGVPSA